jgi:hypothetical protein
MRADIRSLLTRRPENSGPGLLTQRPGLNPNRESRTRFRRRSEWPIRPALINVSGPVRLKIEDFNVWTGIFWV